MVTREQLNLSLRHIPGSEWSPFEKLCSRYLSKDLPGLRVMATPSGDDGADATLFYPGGTESVVLQFSLREDWKSKISQTAKRVKETYKKVTTLVYVTNQEIGARGSQAKITLLEQFGLFLDIRDISWFLDRIDEHDAVTNEFYQRFGRPLLANEELIVRKSSPLKKSEAKALLTYLSMQLRDDNAEKGFTRKVFESLVRWAVRGTTHKNPMSRKDILNKIISACPSQHTSAIQEKVNSALDNANKFSLKQLPNETYYISHAEQLSVDQKIAEELSDRISCNSAIGGLIREYDADKKTNTSAWEIQITETTLVVIEQWMNREGEMFAAAVCRESTDSYQSIELRDILLQESRKNEQLSSSGHFLSCVEHCITRVLQSDNEHIVKFLKRLSDSYTLMAFLHETSDIQGATKKLFGGGKIWLDTTILLPLLTSKLPGYSGNKYFDLISAMSDSGIELRVIPGVINEVCAHFRKCIHCVRLSSEWVGPVPYFLGSHINLGNAPSTFVQAVSLIIGDVYPEDDLKELLLEEYDISTETLSDQLAKIEDATRQNVELAWSDGHAQRRGEMDQLTLDRLVKHDVESFLGVLPLRSDASIVGEYSQKFWWMTIDSHAWKMALDPGIKKILSEINHKSPLISPNFMLKYLSFAPDRTQLSSVARSRIPFAIDSALIESVPKDFLSVADAIRSENAKLDERNMRRRIREALETARSSSPASGNNWTI